MDFRIADSFTRALGRLTRDEQKAVKTSAFDLQTNPDNPGLQLHRVEASKDSNFWSCRVNRDIRIIIHKTAQSFLLAYVDHHDEAYAWAERRRIEAHPRTGATQIVEVRERVEELSRRTTVQLPLDFGDGIAPLPITRPRAIPRKLFETIPLDDLLSVGVPPDWLADVTESHEDNFLDLAAHLPAEAGEALLEYVSSGILKKPAPIVVADPFAHPDAQRRFRVIENVEELERALDLPWEQWTVFLHPSQRAMVSRTYSGPARVAGSAGTGKTVVAIHRAARFAASGDRVRVLLTTFSEPLAAALGRKVKVLAGDSGVVVPRITVASFIGVARDLYQLAHGRSPQMASEELIRSLLTKAAATEPEPINARFLHSEWSHVVDAWQIKTLEGYADVPRLGRKNRMGKKQRDRLWPVFARVLADLEARGFLTESGVFQAMADYYAAKTDKPFNHIVVDEAQDLGVPELRFLVAIAQPGADALFFAGDLGQRIFQHPFSWKALGVSVQGRSHTLKVNYRTSHQIREAADRLLPAVVKDVDGHNEERKGTISVFNGPEPYVVIATDAASEVTAVAAFISAALVDGVQPDEIGVFVRTRDVLTRARDAVKAAGRDATEITMYKDGAPGNVRIGVMHLAKGLEFKAVAVMACDDDLLPLSSRIESVADETELDNVFETERQLFYVACTRARDRLMVSGVKPGSEFVGDLRK
jgi:mRNA-degrading endonuclease RelE of RelBE toxin-antitoxin system